MMELKFRQRRNLSLFLDLLGYAIDITMNSVISRNHNRNLLI